MEQRIEIQQDNQSVHFSYTFLHLSKILWYIDGTFCASSFYTIQILVLEIDLKPFQLLAKISSSSIPGISKVRVFHMLLCNALLEYLGVHNELPIDFMKIIVWDIQSGWCFLSIYIYIYTSFYYLLIKVLKLRVRFVFVGPTLLVSRTEVSRLDVHFCWSIDCVRFMAGAGEIGSNTQNQQRSTGSFITIHLDIRGECRWHFRLWIFYPWKHLHFTENFGGNVICVV